MYRIRIKVLTVCIIFTLFNLNVYGANPITDLLQSASSSISDEIGQPGRVGDLEETYDIDSGFYNEKLANGYEFLSSVPNGAVVSDAVYFDVPMGLMNADLEYEGRKIDFKNKTLIYDKGYYILRLSAMSDGEPLIGVFTFRISGAPLNRTASAIYKYPVVSCTAAISDYGDGMYKYLLPNYKAFLTNISSYGENVENAKFIIPRNMGYSLVRNGQKISLVNNQVYSAPGNYYLRVYGSSYASGNGYEAYYETVLNFSIGSTTDNGASSSSSDGSSQSSGGLSGAIGNTLSGSSGSSVSSALSSVSSAAGSVGSAISSASSSISGTGSSVSGALDSARNNLSSLTSRFSFGSGANEELINDYLSETYFENAQLYSETFSSGDAFYTNTPEDGIVGGNVYIDIPYNMTVSMTKDGLPVSFENKTYINEEGSYAVIIVYIG